MKRALRELLNRLPFFRTHVVHLQQVRLEASSLRILYFDLQAQVLDLRQALAEEKAAAQPAALDEFSRLLQPARVVNGHKIRIGGKDDGGYVMLDEWPASGKACSVGLGADVSWDVALAERGFPVDQFDYSVAKSPQDHPLFTFYPRKIETFGDLSTGPLPHQILKIDIEGYEWPLFASATSADLENFDQIVGEFHDFDLFHQPAWRERALGVLRKLNQTHQLIHLHGNNFRTPIRVGEAAIPFAMELTYVRRAGRSFAPTDEPFPGPLDASSVSGRDEISLAGFLALATRNA